MIYTSLWHFNTHWEYVTEPFYCELLCQVQRCLQALKGNFGHWNVHFRVKKAQIIICFTKLTLGNGSHSIHLPWVGNLHLLQKNKSWPLSGSQSPKIKIWSTHSIKVPNESSQPDSVLYILRCNFKIETVSVVFRLEGHH